MIHKIGRLFLLLLLLLWQFKQAWAFPEMVRHGYVNCTSCHVSPTGGGLLNPYGRQSSATVLSTWGGESEAQAFYDLSKMPNWVNSQAFLRGVQTAQNNSALSSGYFWLMEADLEGAFYLGEERKWTFAFSVGSTADNFSDVLDQIGSSGLLSRRHYVMYRTTETQSIRAGRFLVDYGINFSNHTIATRQGIGFGVNSETYNTEWTYRGETYSSTATLDLGRPDMPSLNREKGGAWTGAISLSDRYKLGWSGYYGTNAGSNRELTGPYAILGFTPHFYFMGEADLQFSQPNGSKSTSGIFSYERLGYEVIQGLHIYLMEQNFVSDFSTQSTRQYAAGPGIYWFPRPHFYLQLEVQQQTSPAFPSAQTAGFLTGNIYL